MYFMGEIYNGLMLDTMTINRQILPNQKMILLVLQEIMYVKYLTSDMLLTPSATQI